MPAKFPMYELTPFFYFTMKLPMIWNLMFLLLLTLVIGCKAPKTDPHYTEMPEESRFTKITLVEKLDEPMELEVLSDGKVLFIERKGKLKLYDPEGSVTAVVGSLSVYPENEDGLLGLAVDPSFGQNGWLYLYYAPSGPESINRLSRFDFKDGKLDNSSEKIMLEIPVFRGCCHSGGSLEFGPSGNLFLSLGDDTSPFASDNYNPIDERPGRAEAFDAQRSSGNSNDLRGSILRIKPESDGTYTIPEGNLFPPGTPNTKPEIYVLGNRNPFRISLDQKTGYLYWGEVGPDAAKDSIGRGPKGHDEINQAKEAGFYGWPYFVGDNKAYWHYDFEKEISNFQYDPDRPVNNSPNNKGVNVLPPAQKALIWYPYDASVEFPLLREGGRNAMAGPVFYSDTFKKTGGTFPPYFDGKLLIYDWMRNWIFLVTMDDNGDYQKMEPFMPSTTFDKPIDMQFGKDGSLYILEYGTFWNSQNDDAGLYRITFSEGNRAPIVRAFADKNKGAAPLKVSFSSEGSFDHDLDDQLTYSWSFEGDDRVQSKLPNPSYSFESPGQYRVKLSLHDSEGAVSEAFVDIQVGNEPPKVSINLKNNQSFYWEKDNYLHYEVSVTDLEDGSVAKGIEPEEVLVTSTYLEEGYDLILASEGHQQLLDLPGKTLMEGSDCYACHALDKASVGPTFLEITAKYDGQDVKNKLIGTVIDGGGGIWGDRQMPAHPQLNRNDVGQMIDYILSLDMDGTVGISNYLDTKGSISLNKHGESFGQYILTASYQDKGAAGMDPIIGREQIQLRYAKVLAAAADVFHDAAKANNQGSFLIKFTADSAFLQFKDIDLHGIKYLTFELDPANTSGKLEFRLGSFDGQLLAETPVLSKMDKPDDTDKRWMDVRVNISEQIVQDDVFIVFRGDSKTSIWNGFLLNTIYFGK